jgi:hypothetical protein
MDFQTVDEVKSKAEMTQSLKWLKRIPRPANFLFKHSCEALEKKPLLLLASPGGKVNRGLAEQLKDGSRPVWGQVRRRGRDLLFVTRGSANRDLMVRRLIQLGNEHGVPLKRNHLMVITEYEGRALMAVERSVRRLRRAKKPVGFVFKGRVDAFGGGPALLLKRGGAERFVRALGSGRLVEGTVVVANGKTTFTVTSGSVSPGQMVALLKILGKENHSTLRNPVVVIGDGAEEQATDMAAAEDVSSTRRKQTRSTDAPSSAPASTAKQTTPDSSKADKAREEALEASRLKAAEESRRKSKENAERAEAERQARETAEAERREQERRERERREQERTKAENSRKHASLPAMKRRHSRAVGELEDSVEELTQAEAARAREEKVFSKKSLRRLDDVEALIDAIIALQAEITSEGGKPDKDLRQLMRDLQREDDIDDAVDEVLEWFEERKDDLDEDVDELRKESQVLQKKVTDLASEIEEIENS